MVNVINVQDIDDSRRLRPVDQDHAEFLAASIKETGLKHPIIVRPLPDDDDDFPYRLVVGGHRLVAFKRLAMRELQVGVHVVIQELTDDEARLAEIDENLARHELNALDRAIFLLERKKVYLGLHPETARGGDRKSNGKLCQLIFAERFSRNAAKKLGLSERAINLAISLAENLSDEAIRDLRGTKIETNQRELLAIAALQPDQQVAVARQIKGGAAKTSAQAKIAAGLEQVTIHDPQSRLYALLLDAWTKADKVTRENFLKAADLTYTPAKLTKK